MRFRTIAGILGAAVLYAQAPSLPVKRVVLYKNGVGYFEHLGKVTENREVSIGFTSGQLDDVLKSLTVLDLGGGRITGVTYGSEAPLERRTGDLRLALSEKTTLAEVLQSLRGARLEIRNGQNTISGRLLSIERKTRSGGGTTLEVDYVSLATDSGELRTTELGPSFSVKVLDKELGNKVNRYLDLLAATHDADQRRMTISTAGTGERPVFVSYISEVPVWKSTYRIVLPEKPGAQPLLQGWAIVDNTVGEDWEKVELSLASGAPQSFVQKLSQPYYSRRPEVGLPESYLAAPQTHQAALFPGGGQLSGRVTDPSGASIAGAMVKVTVDPSGGTVGQTTTGADGNYFIGGLPESQLRVEVSSPGFQSSSRLFSTAGNTQARVNVALPVGSVSETVSVTANAGAMQTMTSSSSVRAGNVGRGGALGSGDRSTRYGPPAPPPPPAAPKASQILAQMEAQATAQPLGDLFEYKLKEPITIRKNQSALVPVVHASVGAEKISLWNPASGMQRPQRALWLDNSSGSVLDGGTFSVMEGDAFAGEGVFDAIRPAEKRLVTYATDLAVTPASRSESSPQRVTRVRVAKGVMIQESELREKRTYTFRNEDTTARTLLVEHPLRSGYELRSEARPAETTAQWMRFRVPVAPKQTATLVVEEGLPTEARYEVANLAPEQVAVFVRDRKITPEIEQALAVIARQKEAASEIESRKSERDDEAEKIFDDQQRLRENLKALKGSPEERALVTRYTRQLDEQENRLDALKKEIKELEKQLDAAHEKTQKTIGALVFDARL